MIWSFVTVHFGSFHSLCFFWHFYIVVHPRHILGLFKRTVLFLLSFPNHMYRLCQSVRLMNKKIMQFHITYSAGLKLRMKSIPLSSASVLYHRFFRENKVDDYDPYVST